jgi:hypothetical protein
VRRPPELRPVVIANCSGFYGDRLSAAREQIDGGPIDVLCGDWLAELTMGILAKDRQRDEAAGYARTFLRQLDDVLADCIERGIRIVSNAGGINPIGCAQAVEALATKHGLDLTVAVVEGDDLSMRYRDATSAHAYLGGFGIAAALTEGADVVVTGRVTDAALVVGPAAWWHGWSRTDWDRLAGAVAAGHIVECGAQACGGNFSGFADAGADPMSLSHTGFAIAEVMADGSAVITKHPGTGGAVTVETVTAQLVYEIQSERYGNPDVVTRLDTIQLAQDGPDRVRVSGTRGEPAPYDTKVAITEHGGWRNTMTFALTGRHHEAKSETIRAALAPFEPLQVEHVGAVVENPSTWQEATTLLRVTAMSEDREHVGRRFSSAVVELALANYPGMYVTSPPSDATAFARFRADFVAQSEVPHRVHLGGRTIAIDAAPVSDVAVVTSSHTATRSARTGASGPLGMWCHARSGDKGGNANVGIWVKDRAHLDWLLSTVTTEWVEQAVGDPDLAVARYELPNLGAVNVVVHDILTGPMGAGAAANPKLDTQAKSLGEYLLARHIDGPA